MKTIKILHVSETFAAGVYTYIKDICEFFDNIEGVDSFVIYSNKREDTNPSKFSIDFSKKTTLIEISMEREISPFNDFKSISLISKQIKNLKPDIIHLHSSKAGVIGRIASKSYRKAKVFYTPNGYSFVRQDISKTKQKTFRTIESLTNMFLGGTTIACGDTEYQHAKNIGKALLVRNGIDVNGLSDLIKVTDNKIFTVGCLGRLSNQKNPALFNLIATKFPNLKFIWVGDGDLRHEITAKNIKITGWVARQEALEILSNLDLYIQTSSWEGLPFTIIEAMSIGKPIIATNVIGNKDAVKHGYNGFVCDTIEHFVTFISKIIEDKNLKNEFGNNSIIRAKDLFDRNKNLKELLKIYKS
jgi:glycosyltransferase involved in cell wall biosynthesis